MDKKCTDLHIAKIAKFLPKWKAVANLLGLERQIVNDIEGLYHNPEDQRSEALMKWVGEAGTQATYQKLYEVLRALIEYDAAEKVKELGEEYVRDPDWSQRSKQPGGWPAANDPSEVLQKNYHTLVDSIQDPVGLADRLYARGVIAERVKDEIAACITQKDKTRKLISAVQQQVHADKKSFKTFIDVLKEEKCNARLVSMLLGEEYVRDPDWSQRSKQPGGWPAANDTPHPMPQPQTVSQPQFGYPPPPPPPSSQRPGLQDTPTPPLLLNFPVGGGATINIIREIGTFYIIFGPKLLNDYDGNIMGALEQQYQQSAESINIAIFNKWFQGTGKSPVTWSTLVTVLRDVDLHTLADQIEGVYQPMPQPRFLFQPQTTFQPQPEQPVLPVSKAAPANPPPANEDNGTPKKLAIDANELDKNNKVVQSDNKFVRDYCATVHIILQTANTNEYTACLSKMKPPASLDKIIKVIIDVSQELQYVYLLGTFGGYNAALVQTKQGNQCRREIEAAIEQFANAVAIIGVGVAFGRDGIKLGDVLVSKQIAELDNIKFQKDNTVTSRGDKHSIARKLYNTFCNNIDLFNSFECTAGSSPRCSKVHCGVIISGSLLVDNRDLKRELFKIEREAIGGEMEGFVLMEIIRHYHERYSRILGAIIIKGVCDYGDGTKEKSWQPIAALAAVEYAHQMLERTAGTLVKLDNTVQLLKASPWQ